MSNQQNSAADCAILLCISDVVDGDTGVWIPVTICLAVLICILVPMSYVFWKYWKKSKVCEILMCSIQLSLEEKKYL